MEKKDACYIYMRNEKNNIDYVGIYFIDHGVFETLPVTDEDMKWVSKELFRIKTEMKDCQKSGVWSCKKSWLCNYCNYKPRCPLYKKFKF